MAIGFFTPLPLAFMIPFMSAQSMAMGESFGKGFQFGKRKISSKTNEEFNAYTYQNMWDETTANINSMIPTLEQSLQTSLAFQEKIFQHMFNLIPTFINAIFNATGAIATQDTDHANEAGIPEWIPHAHARSAGGPATLGPDLGSKPYKQYTDTGTQVNTTTLVKRVQTPNLSKYDTMTVFQLNDALKNASGTLASYLKNLLRKKINVPIKVPQSSSIGHLTKTITFHYNNQLHESNPFKIQRQVYKFSLPGHIRKANQIKTLMNTARTAELPHRKKSLLDMLIKYTSAIKKAYNLNSIQI